MICASIIDQFGIFEPEVEAVNSLELAGHGLIIFGAGVVQSSN